MNAADPLVLLIRNLNETKSAGLIRNVLLPRVLKDVIKDVESSHFYFIIDESAMVDYRLSQIESGDANTISDSFKSQLIKYDLNNLKKLIDISVYGGNVMIGQHQPLATI